MKKILALTIVLQLCLGGLLGWDYRQRAKHDEVKQAHIKHMTDMMDTSFQTELLTYHQLAKHTEQADQCSKCQVLIDDFKNDYQHALKNND